MTFTTRNTANGDVLVRGTDGNGVDGSQVLRSELWIRVKEFRAYQAADAEFNTTVEDFFGPLIKAAEARDAVHAKKRGIGTITLVEATEGVDAVPAEEVVLDPQGIVLMLLEEGKHDLLEWVNGELVALEA